MPDNPTHPDQPASGDLPPEPPRADDTAVQPPQEPQEPQEPSRFGRAAGSKTTALVAAGLAGVLIGAGTMALIAFTGDDDRDDRDDRPARAEMYRHGDGPYFDKRGPMMREMRPWRGDLEPLEPGVMPGERFKDRVRDLLKGQMVPDHHHDEDGNMVPGPAPEKEGGN